MDTPRTNLGDATYLGRPAPDFDMTQEPSFLSPNKDDNNILNQLRNGRGASLRTPRGSRGPLIDRRNMPAGLGGAEFTPMLKSATRNSARRRSNGKENKNGQATPALGKINEDMDLSRVESSLYGPSRSMSYVDATPLPVEVDESTVESTPIVLPTRRAGNKGPLQDGNQLSLREQENVIDKIEKENFGLKLKIHFLEEALRKAGPGFSEAALKENTDLKVDQVTMQRELSKYKKQLASAEDDLETYQHQILEVQEKAKKKYATEGQKAENEALRRNLDDKETEIADLRRQLERQSKVDDKVDELRGEISDLEADLRAKDRDINDREDEIEDLKTKLEDMEENLKSAEDKAAELEKQQSQPNEEASKVEELQNKVRDLEVDLREKDLELGEKDEELNDLEDKLDKTEANLKAAQKKAADLEEAAHSSEELAEAKDTIEELEMKIRRFERQLEDAKDELQQAVSDKCRAENDLEELQEELANKSVVTKGLSRQVEEKATRLQAELSKSQEKYDTLERQMKEEERVALEVRNRAEVLLKQRKSWDSEKQDLLSKLKMAQSDLKVRTDEKNLLQLRHDALGDESASFQREINRFQKQINDLEDSLDREKSHALQMERESKRAHQSEVDRLNDDIADLQDEIERVRKDATGGQSASASLEREVSRLQKRIGDLESNLERERTRSQQFEQDKRAHESEVDRLNDDIADLRDEIDRVGQDASGGRTASTSLEREVSQLQKRIAELERSLEQEKTRTHQSEQDINRQHKIEVDRLRDDIADLQDENERVRKEATGGQSASASLERELSRLQKRTKELETELEHEKANARVRHNTSGDASASLQREITRLRDQVSDLELNLDQEKSHGLQIERDTRSHLKSEIDRLNDEISELQAEIREKENRYRNDNETWRSERMDLESQRDRLEDRATGLQRTIDRLRDEGGTLSGKEVKLQDALTSEVRRHKDEESALSRQIDDLRRELTARQTALTELRDEVSLLQDELRQSDLDSQAQAEKIEALEDEIEVLQSTLDEETEDASQKLREADELCRNLRRQLDQAKRDQVQRTDRLEQLAEADKITENLRQQLEQTKRDLQDAELERDEMARKAERLARRESKQADEKLTEAGLVSEELREQLAQAFKESRKMSLLCDDLRAQLEAANQDLDEMEPVCEQLRLKLDRVRVERAEYKAAAESLEREYDRLETQAQEAEAWIQAKKAADDLSVRLASKGIKSGTTKGKFQYGDLVIDVVDQKDHEAVIRAAAAASKRHEKELRGMMMQVEYMQAKWEREKKLRHDGAFAKKFLQLKLDIADACTRADLRMLGKIHQDLGMPSPEELYEMKRKPKKPVNKLKVLAAVLRAVARMRMGAQHWSKHEKTRQKLVTAWQEQKQQKELEAMQ